MSLRKLPRISAFQQPKGYSWDVPSDALARWSQGPSAAEADEPNTITIYDMIGEDMWTGGGFTPKRMSAALRAIGAKEVTVKINSPGGNVFDGFTIYNQLREHPAKVTIDVMGIAASAASVIAMAGDEIRMGLGTFVMVHNAWGVVIGNRHDLTAAGDVLSQIDGSMADIYESRSGLARKEVETLMDAETFLGAAEAVDKGFADTVAERETVEASARARPEIAARRKLDALLAHQGVPRSERRRMLASVGGNDADPASDGEIDVKGIERLIETLRA